MQKTVRIIRNTAIAAAAAAAAVWITNVQIEKNKVSEAAAEKQEALQNAVYSGLSDDDIRVLIDSLSDEQKQQILRAAGIDIDLSKIDIKKVNTIIGYLENEDYEGLAGYADNNLSKDDIEAFRQIINSAAEQAE